ncbi:MAG: Uma2 family endonuclease [Planctomycetota bacterium]|nr:Uma2 family endonuclease [Planctomycetota bacterium]
MNPVMPLEQDQNVAVDSRTEDWRYGRRYLRRVDEHGEVTYDEVPLTLEDMLHPEEGDEHVSVPGHSRDCRRLYDGLTLHLPKDRTVVALDDCNVDLCLPGISGLRPDVAVLEVPRVPQDFDDLGTFHMTKHQGVPLLFIEVTSRDTRKNDVGIKLEYYEQAGVKQYVLVDRAHPVSPRLTGYVLGPQGFEVQQPDGRGRLWLHDVGLWIAYETDRAVLYDGDEVVPDSEELVGRVIAAQQEADGERIRAEQAELKILELQAQLQRLKDSDGGPKA